MYLKTLFIIIILFVQSVEAVEVAGSSLKKINLFPDKSFSIYPTHPVVLLYSSDGELYRDLMSPDIFNYDSYFATEKLRHVSPNISELFKLTNLEKKDTSKPTLVFLTRNTLCPPCITILNKFNTQLKADLEKKFEIYVMYYTDQ